MDDKMKKRLDELCGNLSKQFKREIVTYLGSDKVDEVERFSTGVVSFDRILGGGWPIGRVIEIFGDESSGKTTLCYHAIASFQKKFPNELVAWIDAEHTGDSVYAKTIGVDTASLIWNSPEAGEEAVDVILALIRNGVKLIVVDSVAALVPKAIWEGDAGAGGMALLARFMSTSLNKMNPLLTPNGATIIFTNQTRDKLGVMFGEKKTTTGGRALRFYASVRVETKTIGLEKEGESVVGIKGRFHIKKSKVCPPLQSEDFVITFGRGMDTMAMLFFTLLDAGVIKKQGSWFSLEEQRMGQGSVKALEFFRELCKDEAVHQKFLEVAKAQKESKPRPRKPVKGVAPKEEEVDAEEGEEDSVGVEEI